MNSKEVKVLGNMISLARKKPKNKRSAMLRMVMPYLSRENGDDLADAIADKDTHKFSKVWDRIRKDLTHKLSAKNKATASSTESLEMLRKRLYGLIQR
jgi:hypothetical protein